MYFCAVCVLLTSQQVSGRRHGVVDVPPRREPSAGTVWSRPPRCRNAMAYLGATGAQVSRERGRTPSGSGGVPCERARPRRVVSAGAGCRSLMFSEHALNARRQIPATSGATNSANELRKSSLVAGWRERVSTCRPSRVPGDLSQSKVPQTKRHPVTSSPLVAGAASIAFFRRRRRRPAAAAAAAAAGGGVGGGFGAGRTKWCVSPPDRRVRRPRRGANPFSIRGTLPTF